MVKVLEEKKKMEISGLCIPRVWWDKWREAGIGGLEMEKLAASQLGGPQVFG